MFLVVAKIGLKLILSVSNFVRESLNSFKVLSHVSLFVKLFQCSFWINSFLFLEEWWSHFFCGLNSSVKTNLYIPVIHLKRNSVNRTFYVVSKLSHPVRVKTSSALVSHGNPYTIRPALPWSFSGFFMCVLLKDPHTFKPYVTDDNYVSLLCRSLLIACEGAYRMRRSKLNLDAKDFATFAAWSDQGNLLSTCSPRSLSEVVHFLMLLPGRRAWIGPVNVDFRCMIIGLRFSGCSSNKFLSQHSWSSAKTLFSAFVSKPIVSAIQYYCVVILGGRLWRARITWVRGPTLAALSDLRCMYRSRIR